MTGRKVGGAGSVRSVARGQPTSDPTVTKSAKRVNVARVVNDVKAELLPFELNLPPDRAPRSPGTHISAILRCMAGEMGILAKEYLEDLSLADVGDEEWWGRLDEHNKIRIAIGLSWEEWYLRTIPGVTPHPGEMEYQGIYLTHDGEELSVIITVEGENYALVVHEVKTTSKSTKTVGNLETQWMWVSQAKAYCKAAGSLIAIIHVLFIYGDYSWPRRPQLKRWRITFTQEEIDEKWEEIADYVRHRQIQDRTDYGLESGS